MNFATTGCILLMTACVFAQIDSGGGKVAVGNLRAIADTEVIGNLKTEPFFITKMPASWSYIRFATT